MLPILHTLNLVSRLECFATFVNPEPHILLLLGFACETTPSHLPQRTAQGAVGLLTGVEPLEDARRVELVLAGAARHARHALRSLRREQMSDTNSTQRHSTVCSHAQDA